MKLVIEDAAGTQSIVPFTSDEITVGRAEGVTFRLVDRDVSRRHARFLRASGSVLVEDLGSLTGTRVNGERIAGRRKLRVGDLVEIGDYDLVVLAEGDAAIPGQPPPLPPPAARLAEQSAVTQRLPDPAEVVRLEARRRALRLALLAGVAALVLGLLSGFAAGTLSASPAAPPGAAAAP
jgi:predicted component of type VI protein secretion system